MILVTLLVHRHRRPLDRVPGPGGLRLRRRHAARRGRRDEDGPPGRHQHHRAGLGRQRGVADRRRGRRCSRPSPAGTRPCSPASTSLFVLLLVALIAARGLVRVPRSAATARAGAGRWDAAADRRQPGRPRCCSASPWATCCTGCRSTRDQEFTGSVGDLLSPYAVFTGVTIVVLCLLHGAAFLALKTAAELRVGRVQVARVLAPMPAVIVLGLLRSGPESSPGNRGALRSSSLIAVLAVVAAVWLPGQAAKGGPSRPRRSRWPPWPCRSSSTSTRGSWSRRSDRERPHGQQHRVVAVRADRDDRRRGRAVPGRPRLPGLDLLHLPTPDRVTRVGRPT